MLRYLMPVLLAAVAAPLAASPLRASARVDLTVEIDGARTPLYDAVDGSDRLYVEAREGARYALNLRNRTGERLGIVLTVDGLNVISGERGSRAPGRMYILGPWEAMTVQGWRSSLDEVRRFTFVEEKASYASRVGRSNSKMGWIEMAVHREREVEARRRIGGEARSKGEASDTDAASEAAPADAAPTAPSASARRAEESEGARAYPGTGWGDRTEDRAVVVDFRPELRPVETATIRYEYAPALEALGIRVGHRVSDRLRQRERGTGGFAPAPRY